MIKITKKPKKVTIFYEEIKEYISKYTCPHCQTTFVGANIRKNVTQFKCDCGQELIVDNRRTIKGKYMKLCGYEEKCFVDGEKAWGHYGSVMCLHLSEKYNEPENISICGLTDEEVNFYTSEKEYCDLVDN